MSALPHREKAESSSEDWTEMSESLVRSAQWNKQNGHAAASRHDLKMARLCDKIAATIDKRKDEAKPKAA